MADSERDWRKPAEQEYRMRRQDLIADASEAIRQVEVWQGNLAEARQSLEELDRAAHTFGIPVVEQIDSPSAETKLYKDVVRDILRDVFPKGMKAKEIEGVAEKGFAKSFHPKTTGMTLYRLALDKEVRRKGYIWFYSPKKAEGPESSEPSADGRMGVA